MAPIWIISNFNNIYLNINYYWIEDDIIPEECNLTIIGSPDNNEKINKNKIRIKGLILK